MKLIYLNRKIITYIQNFKDSLILILKVKVIKWIRESLKNLYKVLFFKNKKINV